MSRDDDLALPESLRHTAPPVSASPLNGNKSTAPVNIGDKPPTEAAKPKSSPAKKPASRKPAAKKVAAKAPKASDHDELVTVVSVAKEYKLSPPETRALLRAAKLKKPAVGGAFAPNSPELKPVREVLKAGKAK